MATLGTLSDNELLALLKEGDHAAFKAIYQRYKAVLFLHARRLLDSDEEAKDVIQEIFTMLWSKREELQFNTSVKSYLYTATRNKIFNLIARQKFEDSYISSLQKIIDAGEFLTDQQVIEKELRTIIELEVARLPEKMRAVFELSRNEQLSHKEIAEQLGISDKTVKKQINNAIKILRPKINLVLLLIPIYYQTSFHLS